MIFTLKNAQGQIVGQYSFDPDTKKAKLKVTDRQVSAHLEELRQTNHGVPLGPEGGIAWSPVAIVEYLRRSGYALEQHDGQSNTGQDEQSDRDGQTLSGVRVARRSGPQGRLAPAQGGVRRTATQRRDHGYPVRPTRQPDGRG